MELTVLFFFFIIFMLKINKLLHVYNIFKLLSGMRPKANTIHLAGDTLMKQVLWGCILADFVSIYVAILNNVDPTQVDLIEKFKQELAG